MEVWWLSSTKMTVKVIVRDGKIVGGATIIRVFIGQPLSNLVNWMRRIGPPLRQECLLRENDDASETG